MILIRLDHTIALVAGILLNFPSITLAKGCDPIGCVNGIVEAPKEGTENLKTWTEGANKRPISILQCVFETGKELFNTIDAWSGCKAKQYGECATVATNPGSP